MKIPKISSNLSKRSKCLLIGASGLIVASLASEIYDIIEDKNDQICECNEYIAKCENIITTMVGFPIEIHHF